MGDIHQLAFAGGAFHAVIVVGVTEWLDSLHQSFQELVRVLKPGGHLIVATDNKWALYGLLDPLLKAVARESTGRTGARKTGPRLYAYSIPDFDSHLRRVGLVKKGGFTLGFGQFSFLGVKVLPQFIGIRLHRILQRLASKGVPLVRSGGHVYLAAASKLVSDR
jgi:SAM-dependent methyltransferase